LGVSLYEAVTLHRPFKPGENSPAAWLTCLERDEPDPPHRHRPKLSRDLEAVILKAIDRSPKARYGSADELADDLGRFLRREPVKARPPGRLSRWGRRLARHRAAVVA